MTAPDVPALVAELVKAVSLRCHSHPGEERRSATARADTAKQTLLDALTSQAAEIAALREAAAAIMVHRVGDLPSRGDLRDNAISRAALARLAALLPTPPAIKDDGR